MKYFLDFEFIEGFKNPLFGKKTHYIEMISIGIVCEDGRQYYAISKDFDVKKVWNTYQTRKGSGDLNNYAPKEYWLRENVLLPIFEDFYPSRLGGIHHYPKFSLSNFKQVVKYQGKSQKRIVDEILEFVYNPTSVRPLGTEEKIEFYGYYCDYDWVLFCSLFGKMIDLPKFFPMFCNDVNQTFNETIENNKKFIVDKFKLDESLDLKKQIINMKNYPKNSNNHNALSNALWILELHNFIKNELNGN